MTVAREGKPSEQLVYQISAPASFVTAGREVRIQSVTVQNRGTAASRDVRASVQFPGIPKVLGRDISFSSGPAADFKVDTTLQGGIRLLIPVLTPNEKVSISYLLEGGILSNPAVSVKSQTMTAGEQKDTAKNEAVSREKLTTVAVALLGAFLMQGYLLFLLRKLRSRGGRIEWMKQRNNTGFVLLHLGYTDRALKVFDAALLAGEADPYLLSNYAVAQAVLGNGDAASQFLVGAEFWASEPRERGQVEFCRTLILLLTTNELAAAESAFASAMKYDEEIPRYLKFSRIVEQLRLASPENRKVLEVAAVSAPSNA